MALSNELISQFAKMSKDNKRESKETTVFGTIVKINDTKYVKIDGSDRLTPISSTTDALDNERVTVMIKDHKAIVNGNISSPAARTGTVKEINDKVVAQGNDILAINNNIIAKENQIIAIDNTVTAQGNQITAIDNTVTSQGNTINQLNDTVTSHGNTITQLNDTVTSQGNDITAINNDIDIYNSSFQIQKGVVTGIKGVSTDWIETSDLEADHAAIKNLDTTYANIDFANIGEAAVEKFYSVSGIIQNLTLETGVVVKELIGVLISGDLIKGNTIQADKLIVRGEDGLYYKLNVDALGETTASADEKYQNGLDGSVIIAKSVTAEKVSVSDLVAFGATIGGFHITGTDTENNTPGAIYSGVKSSADNTTFGIYLDSDGQVSFGDSNNFVKFYKDDNNNYKLNISADILSFGATKKSVEDSFDDVNDDLSITNNKFSEAMSLCYKVTHDSTAGTYTRTDERISCDDFENIALVENAVTETEDLVYSGTNPENLTVYFAKTQANISDVQDTIDDAGKRITDAESLIQQLGEKIVMTVEDENGKTSLTQTSGGWVFNLDDLNDSVDDVIERVATTEELIGNDDTFLLTESEPEDWSVNYASYYTKADNEYTVVTGDSAPTWTANTYYTKNRTGLLGKVQTLEDDTKSLSDSLKDQGEYIRFYKKDGQPYLELGNSSNFKVLITNEEIQFLDGTEKVAYISNKQLYIEKSTIKQELEIGDNSGFIWKSRDSGNMGLQWFERSDQ